MSPRRNGSKEKHFVKSQQRKTVIDNDAKYNDKKKKDKMEVRKKPKTTGTEK